MTLTITTKYLKNLETNNAQLVKGFLWGLVTTTELIVKYSINEKTFNTSASSI